MNKKVLCVTYGGGHANIIKSIFSEMKQRGLEVVVLALTKAPEIFNLASIEHIRVSEALEYVKDKEIIEQCGEIIAKGVHDNNSGIMYEDTVAYYGIGYYELTKKYGEEEARKLFDLQGRKAFLPIEIAGEIIDGIVPDAVIVTTSPRMEMAFGIAASARQIPVVRVCDLPIIDKPVFKCVSCIMNDWAKEYCINQQKMSEDEIVVTGQPVFEENQKIDDAVLFKYKNAVKNYSNVVLYLGQSGIADTEITVRKLYDYAKNNPNDLVIIRPHPNDNINFEFNDLDNIIITKLGELKYIIKVSDVAITHYSTSGIEAALMGVPLITVMVKTDKIFRLAEYGIAHEINNIEDLEIAIKQCLTKDSSINLKLRDGIKNFCNKKNATQNIVDVINECIFSNRM